MQTNNVTVIGMGRLGVCLAAVLSEKGFSVTGVDLNADIVAKINAGLAPCDEPGLQEILSAQRTRLRATVNCGEAVAAGDITIIFVGTPQDSGGVMTCDHVLQAAHSVGRALKSKKDYHLIMLRSTVLPGVAGREILPAIERASGRKCGVDFGFCYVPEFVAAGSVINDMLNPALVVIGGQSPEAWALVKEFYTRCLSNNPPFHRMNLVNAELTKIALNVFVAAKINFANVLGELCERLPGADVDAVTRAVGSDPRIGAKAFTAGAGFGGPCFIKDVKSFASLLGSRGVSPRSLKRSTCTTSPPSNGWPAAWTCSWRSRPAVAKKTWSASSAWLSSRVWLPSRVRPGWISRGCSWRNRAM